MIRLLALLALVSLPAFGWGTAGGGLTPCPKGYVGGGLTPCTLAQSFAFFEFAPAPNAFGVQAGMGTACACAPVTGAKGEAVVFARASVAYCTKADYSLVQCAADQPRAMPGRPGAPLGLLVEQDATNLVTQNSDLSQAVWTKTNVTCTLTATGPTGAVNTASRCTASAASGTVVQALVRASSTNSTTAYVRRQTGVGVVEALDVSGAYQAVTASLTTDWKRVACRDTEGCMGGRCIVVPSMCATSTNPSVGFRITTSGDAIDIALVQNEATLRPSSPIATAAVSATRVGELAYRDTASFIPVSLRLGVVGTSHTANEYALMVSNGAAAPFTTLYAGSPFSDWVGNVGCINSATGGTASAVVGLPAGGVAQYSCDYGSVNSGCADGRCETTLSTPTNSAATRIYLGGAWVGAVNNFHGVLSEVCVGTASGNCSATAVRPAGAGHIAWLGDSITQGTTTSHPTYPTGELYRLYGQYGSKQVMNYGYLGYGLTTPVLPVWNNIKTKGFGSLVVLLGVNDLRAGVSAATIWALYQPILDEAKALGWNVTPVKVLCWGAWAEWTAGKQTETDTLNASLQSWCTANGKTCVDTSATMCTGNNLSATYNYGDGLHLNAAGATQLATLVAAANP